MKSALIVFAREPRDGKVKTRLARDLPARAVTRLYKAFIRDVLRTALQVACAEKFLFYSIGKYKKRMLLENSFPMPQRRYDEPRRRRGEEFSYDAGGGSRIPFLRKAAVGFRLKKQAGKDLGERMFKAFAYCRKAGFQRTVLIGTDCITLTARDIERAFEALGSHDCVLGPAKDGGYYLIALKEPREELFRGVEWGTTAVFRKTVQRARMGKRTVFLLPPRGDIDRLDQLKEFSKNIRSLKLAPRTRSILQQLNIP